MPNRLQNTKQLVSEAGQLIKNLMSKELIIENKSAKDWVTNIDKEVEQFLVEKILDIYPNSSFLTEEDTVDFMMNDEVWIIDPIDGTSNLIHQKENFAISVAYFYKEKPVFGIVYDVIQDDMVVGIHHEGAYINDRKIEPLHAKISLENSILQGNFIRAGLFKVDINEILNTIATFRYLGSGALEVSRVANHQASAYVFPKIKIWDVAAALIILQEVGGTWLLGDKIDTFIFDKESHPFLACANKTILNHLMSWM